MRPAYPATVPREFTIRLPPDEDLMQVSGVSFLQIEKGVTKMKQRISVLLLCALLTVPVSGCAETPEASPVVQKDQAQLIETADSLEDPSATIAQQVNAPERVETSFSNEDGSFTVDIDAPVILPDADHAQIIRVTGRDFTQSEVDTWTETLLGDQPLYDPSVFSEPTRSEVEELLLEAQRQLAELVASGETDEIIAEAVPADEEGEDTGEAEAVEYSRSDELRDLIASYQERFTTAPEERVLVETTNELARHEGQDHTWAMFSVLNAAGDGLDTMNVVNFPGFQQLIYTKQRQLEYSGTKYYRTYEEILEFYADSLDQSVWNAYLTLPELDLTQDEAEALGNAFVALMGFDELELIRAEQAVAESSQASALTMEPLNDMEKGWVLNYLRNVNGIPLSDTRQQGAYPDEGEWWAYETLVLFVTDDGVTECEYTAPYALKETLTERCKLLDFNSVLEVFQTMMPITYLEDWSSDDITGHTEQFDITEIRFGYTRITESNNSYSGLLVPTWTFYGQNHTTYTRVSDGDTRSYTGSPGQDWMTINAIDGSVIDVSLGY